ncbi:MAG: glycosyltransferase family 39 protein [Bacteroidetes bacterium]|nr:MAG: glycosyltransferase family 39 protein [Bacteroidota bacterium]
MHHRGPLSYLRSHFPVIGLLLLIVFYFVNGIYYLRSQSVTSDEGSFYTYAVRYLKGAPDRIIPVSDNSKMPVTVLNTIPRLAQQAFSQTKRKDDGGVSDIMHGRYMTLLVSVLTIVLVFIWSSELYGQRAGLFSAFLTSICPNHMASAGLVTTDAYSVLFLIAVMYFLWKYCTTKSGRHFIFLSITMALSQLVKQSLFHLYILAPFCIGVYFTVYPSQIKYNVLLRRILIFLLVNWLVINIAWYFYQSFWRTEDYHFMSDLFQTITNILPPWMPIPLPKPFVDGLDMAKYYDDLGGGFDPISSFGKVTILGHAKTGGGLWYYYFVSIFYKTPIAYFILLLWSTIVLVKTRSFKAFVAKEFFLFAPVIYFLIVLSFFYQTQTGLRHIIFIYPFIFIAVGAIVPGINARYQKTLLVLTSLFLLISVFRYWRNYYPYTNEFIADKKMAFQYVGASNLEFKQGGFFLQRYLRDHPQAQIVSLQPRAGSLVMSVADYLDIWNRHQYDWIQQFKPIDHVAYTYLVFEIEEKNLKR